MGATARKVMTTALGFLGVKESPAGSNNVKFNTDYYGHEVFGSAYQWCCTYIWDVFRIGGASKLFYDGLKTASCTAVLNWAIKNGLTVDRNKGQYGDIVLFDWDGTGDADHIGLIIKQNADGTYQTIEGNTAIGNDSNGGEVMERTRLACIRAIVRPKYETETLTYRAYCQTYGWREWAENGEVAGTTGEGKRLEALQFGNGSKITAQCHCQSYGDMNIVYEQNIAGTVAESKRMEAIKLDAPYKIKYRVHVQGTGWTAWANNGEWCGTKGQGKRLEAIQVKRA